MEYKKEFSVRDFEWWSGAKYVIDSLEEQGRLDELEELVETAFDGMTPTETEVNDFVWFDALEMLAELHEEEDEE